MVRRVGSGVFHEMASLTVSLKVLLGGADELHGDELEADSSSVSLSASLAGRVIDNGSLDIETHPRLSKRETMGPTRPRW